MAIAIAQERGRIRRRALVFLLIVAAGSAGVDQACATSPLEPEYDPHAFVKFCAELRSRGPSSFLQELRDAESRMLERYKKRGSRTWRVRVNTRQYLQGMRLADIQQGYWRASVNELETFAIQMTRQLRASSLEPMPQFYLRVSSGAWKGFIMEAGAELRCESEPDPLLARASRLDSLRQELFGILTPEGEYALTYIRDAAIARARELATPSDVSP